MRPILPACSAHGNLDIINEFSKRWVGSGFCRIAAFFAFCPGGRRVALRRSATLNSCNREGLSTDISHKHRPHHDHHHHPPPPPSLPFTQTINACVCVCLSVPSQAHLMDLLHDEQTRTHTHFVPLLQLPSVLVEAFRTMPVKTCLTLFRPI